jgi:hypothetical protein
MNMKRMIYSAEVHEPYARDHVADLQQQGRKPEVYLRTENIEGMRVSIFVVVCDSVVDVTHGKNGTPELPAIKD